MVKSDSNRNLDGQVKINHRGRQLLAALISFSFLHAAPEWSFGQAAAPPKVGQSNKPAPPSANVPTTNKGTPPRKLTEAEKAAQAVLNAYTDAANFQNSGAYPLAIEAWQKLLKNYPSDPLASKAKHYLGICYLQGETPDYPKAIANLRSALEDSKLEVREESLVNLGRALFDSARTTEGEEKNKKLAEASSVFSKFLESYADGSFADQAIFYAGEAEYQLGRLDKAISFYRRLTESPATSKSAIRPDGYFALGVAYEEQNQPKLAGEAYEEFLKAYPEHRLLREVQLRAAEQRLNQGNLQGAIDLFRKLSEDKNSPLQDYVLYRYGYALAKAGKFTESSAIYQRLSKEFPNSKYANGSSLAAGQALMRDKNYDGAAQAFKTLLPKQDETAAEAAHLLCQIALAQNKAADAVPVAKSALVWAGKMPQAVSLKLDLADGLSSLKDSQAEAKVLYEQIATQHADDPSAPRATYNVAFSALQLGNADEAKKWSETFAKRFAQDPLAPDVAYIFAESTLQLGQHKEAATAFEQLIAGQANNPQLLDWEMRLGHARYLGGDLDKAIAQMNAIIKRAPSKEIQAEASFLKGASLLKQDKFAEAEEALNQCISIAPQWTQSDEAHLILAQTQMKANKNDQAKKTLEKLIKDFPTSRFKTQAEYRLGQLSASTGNFPQAIIFYDSVLASKEKSYEDFAKFGKSYALMQMQEFQKALDLLTPLCAKERKDSIGAESRLAKAVCLRNLGKSADAAHFLAGLVADPTLGVPVEKSLYELGLVQSELEQFDQASKTFGRLVREFPKHESIDKIWYEYAWSLKEQGNDAEASKAFATLSRDYPNSPVAAEADYHFGQTAYEGGEYEKAIASYTKALAKTTDAALKEKGLYKLAWAYYQSKDYKKASENFAKQVQQYPSTNLAVEASFMQGECFMKLNNFADALPHYVQARKALDALPDKNVVSEQIRSLLFLHGAQAAREVKKWTLVDSWLSDMVAQFPDSSYKPYALYEQAYSAQSQGQVEKAIQIYNQVAENNRTEIGARARFMIGEVYFSQRDFGKAVPEFQKVMFGYGATQASSEIKNWQARSAVEAGRCSEVLIGDLIGARRAKAIQVAKGFYQFVTENHRDHELVTQAKDRIAELERLEVASR